MALRINEDIREEWDSIDFEHDSLDYKQRDAPSQSKNINKTKSTSTKHQGKTKDLGSLPRNVRQSPTNKHVRKDISFSQEHTGETQECITIEPRPSIVPNDRLISVVERQPQYKPWNLAAKQSDVHGGAKTVNKPEAEDSTDSTSFGWSDEGRTQDMASGSRNKRPHSNSHQDPASSSQEAPSSIDETEDSLTEDEESDLDSSIAELGGTINLPYDSDNEELKAAEEERVCAYTKTHQLVASQSLDGEEESSTQSTRHTKESLENPAIRISSGIAAANNDSQYSLSKGPSQPQPSSVYGSKQYSSPIKGNLIHIPVSSSTGISQNLQSLESSDVHIQHTPPQSRTSEDTKPKMKTPLRLRATPMVLATSAKPHSPFTSPIRQEDSPGAALQRSAAAFSSPIRPSVSFRKHQRSSRESSAELYTTIRKRQRLESPIDLSSTSRGAVQPTFTALAITPPPASNRNQATSTPQSTSVQITNRTDDRLPSTTDQRSPVPHHHKRSTKSDTTRFKSHIVQQPQQIRGVIDFDHNLPRVSASQPIPDRPRIRPAYQVRESKPSSPTKAIHPTMVRNEISESPEPSSPETPELELEPLTKILNLQGADYCAAVQRDHVFGSLQRLYCEFLARHLTYLGDMNHFFNLCTWLLRSRADPDERGCIDEDFWDDFILQHREGRYDAYVRRSLAKFRQPGSWSAWYHQTEKGQSGSSIVTAQRLEQILLGQEPVAEKLKVPFLWSRFKHMKVASVAIDS